MAFLSAFDEEKRKRKMLGIPETEQLNAGDSSDPFEARGFQKNLATFEDLKSKESYASDTGKYFQNPNEVGVAQARRIKPGPDGRDMEVWRVGVTNPNAGQTGFQVWDFSQRNWRNAARPLNGGLYPSYKAGGFSPNWDYQGLRNLWDKNLPKETAAPEPVARKIRGAY